MDDSSTGGEATAAKGVSPEEPRRRAVGPSRGCNQCRIRKVKCDEKQPSCAKCVARGTTCVYRNNFDRLLRDQTKEVTRVAQIKWRSRAKHSKDAPQLRRGCPSGVRPALMPPLCESVKNRFLFDFVVPLAEDPINSVSTTNGSYFGWVPAMYEAPTSISPLVYAALLAVSYANFAARCSSVQVHLQSLAYYGKALRALGQALQARRANEWDISDELTSTCLLSNYELLAPPQVEEATRELIWSNHSTAVAALLKTSYEKGHQVGGTATFPSMLTQMLIENMLRLTKPAISLELCLQLVPRGSDLAILLKFFYRTADLGAQWKETEACWDQHPDRTHSIATAAKEIVTTALDLDETIYPCLHKVMGHAIISRNRDNLADIPRWLHSLYSLPGAPKIHHRHRTIHTSHKWHSYKAARLILLTTAMWALQCMPPTTLRNDKGSPRIGFHRRETQRILESRMVDTIEQICQGVLTAFTVPIPGKPEPQGFADVVGIRGYQLIWPLNQAILTTRRFNLDHLIASGRCEWLQTVRSCVKHELGLGILQ
ncbi:hypothetical protein BX600DRAFT_117724 [Xylariales sp. PMI_506]|nr:hypothetical protein BX600DRAFT_117724 [Xylariales sp. PMI_506]